MAVLNALHVAARENREMHDLLAWWCCSVTTRLEADDFHGLSFSARLGRSAAGGLGIGIQ